MRNQRVQKTVLLGLLTAVAILLSWVELMLPPIVSAVPGIKIGLANVAILFVLYRFSTPWAMTVSLVRIGIVAMLFGNVMTLAYSVVGAVFSLALMAALKKTDAFSTIGVSISGAVFHNLGQVLTAMALLGTAEIGYYLIVLTISGVVGGIAVGILGAMLLKRIKI